MPILIILFFGFFPKALYAEDQNTSQPQKLLVEPFTAHALDQSEWKLGSEIAYGITNDLMVGTDSLNIILAIPSIFTKYSIYEHKAHKFALGFTGTYFNIQGLMPFAPVKEYYEELTARHFRPQISYTQTLSGRLAIHTHWTKGYGTLSAKLSEEGKRNSWESKHPGQDYDTRNQVTAKEEEEQEQSLNESTNQENTTTKPSNTSRRTLELQSLFGLSTDRFQITGEITRQKGAKVLITSSIEKSTLEKLSARSIRLTFAQHWTYESFQFRVGIGVMSLSIQGTDLDGELVNESGLTPVSDLAFYWRL